jgi:hypothetical protein
LLAKNPARLHSFDLAFGKVHVFYPEASLERCTAALLLDVDPVGLVRGRHGPAGEGGALEQYVNDRPYVASSFLVQHSLDETNPDWGGSRYFTVTLRATKRLGDLLTHLYVLVPVLDDDKHYWVSHDEVEKLHHDGSG